MAHQQGPASWQLLWPLRLAVVCAPGACLYAAGPPFYPDKSRLLVYQEGGTEYPVRTEITVMPLLA